MPYAQQLGPVVHEWDDIPHGDVLFLLSCERIVPPEYLARNASNVVIHPSALPHGRGWSPVAWQVLEGAANIPVTLFEAVENVDEGPVYLVGSIKLDGTELNDEIKRAQGRETLRLAREYLRRYPMEGRPQQGKSSWYRRRTPADSRVESEKTIAEQFELLRVVDNRRYPAFFEHRGRRYRLRIDAA